MKRAAFGVLCALTLSGPVQSQTQFGLDVRTSTFEELYKNPVVRQVMRAQIPIVSKSYDYIYQLTLIEIQRANPEHITDANIAEIEAALKTPWSVFSAISKGLDGEAKYYYNSNGQIEVLYILTRKRDDLAEMEFWNSDIRKVRSYLRAPGPASQPNQIVFDNGMVGSLQANGTVRFANGKRGFILGYSPEGQPFIQYLSVKDGVDTRGQALPLVPITAAQEQEIKQAAFSAHFAQNREYMANMAALNGALDSANTVASASADRSAARLNETLATAARQASNERATTIQQTARSAGPESRPVASPTPGSKAAVQIPATAAPTRTAALPAARQAASSAKPSAPSTAEDANRCMSSVQLSTIKQCSDGATSARVVNSCAQTIDVRICLQKTNGQWDCGATYGLAPAAAWSYWSCKATSNVFTDARSSTSSTPLRQP